MIYLVAIAVAIAGFIIIMATIERPLPDQWGWTVNYERFSK
jgi:hypothetical protein